jgi:uncharacterized membrane protein YtjA (UPF0391 family)
MITLIFVILIVFLIVSLLGATPRLGPGNASEIVLVVVVVLLLIWLAGGLGEGRVL